MLKKSLIIMTLGTLSLNAFAFELTFSRGIPKAQREKLSQDVKVLKSFQMREAADEETLKILDIKNLENATMVKWLADRVQYIVEDKDIEKFKLSASRENFVYPYPGQFPDIDLSGMEMNIEIPLRPVSDDAAGVTVMSNIGTAFYFIGKLSDQLLRLRIRVGLLKFERIDITSPRVGVLQIGEGLFMDRFDFNRENPKALSNSLNRLSTLFHEARHSDGHGAHLGFFHAICPMGHPFAGEAACDKNLNGPYAVGAQVVKEFAKNCVSCNESEIEQMKLSFLDSRSRMITETVTPILTAEQQLELDEIDAAMKELFLRITAVTSEDEAELLILEFIGLNEQREAILANAVSVDVVASPFLDPKPEGSRRK